MPKIPASPSPSNDNDVNLDHYVNGFIKPMVNRHSQKLQNGKNGDELLLPKQLNARPIKKMPAGANEGGASSGSKTGRVAIGILTLGISELLRLAWRGIKSCCSSFRQAQPQRPRIQAKSGGIPAAEPQEDQKNSQLIMFFRKPLENPVPEEYQQAMSSALDELREDYGEELIPKGKDFIQILADIRKSSGVDALHMLFQGVSDARRSVSPADLEAMIKREVRAALNRGVLEEEMRTAAQECGGLGGVDLQRLLNMLIRQPGPGRELAAASSLDEARGIAGRMNMRQFLTVYRNAILDTARELRFVYGENTLPADLGAMLALTGDDGLPLYSKINDQLLRNRPLEANDLKDTVSHFLKPILRQRAVENAIRSEAEARGMALNSRALKALTRDALSSPEARAPFAAAQNTGDIQKAIEGLGIGGLLSAHQAGVEETLNAQLQKIRPELKPILRRFIEGLSFAPASAAASRQAAAQMAGHMQHWKNLDGSEEERRQINGIFRDSFASDYAMLADAPGEAKNYKNNMYSTILDDAHRSTFIINGKTVTGDEKTKGRELTESLKTAAPDARDQQFLSKIMNQRLWWNMENANCLGILPNGSPVADVPGGSTLPIVPGNGQHNLLGQGHSYSVFSVDIAPDKKTAVLTATCSNSLQHTDGFTVDGKMPEFGTVKLTYRFQLTLNSHENGQGITGFTLGQEFLPQENTDAELPE